MNWRILDIQPFDISHLDAPFTEDELYFEAFKQTPPQQSTWSDGFTDAFYKSSWPIIKVGFLAVAISLHGQCFLNFDLLNKVNIVLLPKRWYQKNNKLHVN